MNNPLLPSRSNIKDKAIEDANQSLLLTPKQRKKTIDYVKDSGVNDLIPPEIQVGPGDNTGGSSGGSGGSNSQNLVDRMVPEDASLAETLGRSAGNVVLPGSGPVLGPAAGVADDLTGGGISDPVENTSDTVADGVNNAADGVADAAGDVAGLPGEAADAAADAAQDAADAAQNAASNAVPDLSGIDGFADRVLIGLALTLVAAAAASSFFSS